ncbi:MAG: MBL fold metallo-hydrolase [Acidobacteria bacterium]|nr:MBL fold metallo-hydrolase [Acidobacteriota bacterium]
MGLVSGAARRLGLVAVVLSVWTLGGQASAAAQSQDGASRFERLENERDNVELQKIPPFKVFDNLYYVGIGHLASWLVTTSDGLILIDALQEPYVDHLIDSIQKLGFDPHDIKYLLVTHAHVDHYGGAAQIQETYGPSVGMIDGDWNALAENPSTRARVPRRDIVFTDGDTLTLGDATLTFHALPGHTPGGLSIEQTVYDAGTPYKAFTLGGVTPRNMFRENIAALERIMRIPGIQVNVPNHPWRGDVLQRAEKLAARRPGEPHPFVAPDDFAALLDELKADAEKQLAEEAP